PWTLFTYMFVHAGTAHLLFNMLGLYFFGPRLEVQLGGRSFLGLYFVSGLTGALLSFASPVTRNAGIVGASGAIYGVFLGYARFWPHDRILIWGIVPVRARLFVGILTLLSLFGGFGIGQQGIAHFAHLGGFLGAWAYLRFAERRVARRVEAWAAPKPPPARPDDLARWARIQREAVHPVNHDELDRVLGKLASQGPASLSLRERTFLDQLSS
ncbi:MAG: rhomboid family intramembrane serine protease, partial [Gemmatimonadales bacterium]